jgi:hypothetical protein
VRCCGEGDGGGGGDTADGAGVCCKGGAPEFGDDGTASLAAAFGGAPCNAGKACEDKGAAFSKDGAAPLAGAFGEAPCADGKAGAGGGATTFALAGRLRGGGRRTLTGLATSTGCRTATAGFGTALTREGMNRFPSCRSRTTGTLAVW